MLYLIAAGFAAGVISGMGMGGGIILIPVLTLLLGFDQKAAQGMNLLFFIPTAIFAITVHAKNKIIKNKTAVKMSAGGVLGACLGSFLAVKFTSDLLKMIFGIFLIFVGFYQFMLAYKQKNK